MDERDRGPFAVLMNWFFGAFLTLVLGSGAFAVGRMVARRACGGACSGLEDITSYLTEPFFLFPDTLTWIAVVTAIFLVGLWIAVSWRPVRWALVLVMMLALFCLGLVLSDGREVYVAMDEDPPFVVMAEPEDAPVALVEAPEPVPAPAPVEVAMPVCPEGTFNQGEGCLPCMVTETAPLPRQVYFDPLPFDTAWAYAKDEAFVAPNAPGLRPINDLTISGLTSSGGRAVCASSAVVVVGSASADGPRGRNVARAERRASELSERVAAECGREMPVYALSLGQSQRDADIDADRALTVLGVTSPDGDAVTRDMVEAELSYALGGLEISTPLLNRWNAFPQDDWAWVDVNVPAAISPQARPVERVEVVRPEAPAACLAFARERG